MFPHRISRYTKIGFTQFLHAIYHRFYVGNKYSGPQACRGMLERLNGMIFKRQMQDQPVKEIRYVDLESRHCSAGDFVQRLRIGYV